MTQEKHTPGPWVAVGGYVRCSISASQAVGKRGVTVADCRVSNGTNDARLIAAAPDLLPIADLVAALPVSEEVADDVPVTGVNGVYITHGDVRAARAAIAKAKGETP